MITYGYCYLLVIPYYSLKAIFLCRIICTNFTNFGPCFWNPNYSWCFRNPKATHRLDGEAKILVNHGKKTYQPQPHLVKAGGPFRVAKRSQVTRIGNKAFAKNWSLVSQSGSGRNGHSKSSRNGAVVDTWGISCLCSKNYISYMYI